MTTPKITLGRETFSLLRADALDATDEARALRLVQRMLDEDPGAGRRLVALAESLTGQWSMTVSDATAAVVRALARGDLVALRERSEGDDLRASSVRPQDLRDIGDDIGPMTPMPSTGSGRDEPAPMSRTFISFEVVDDTGAPIVGEFRVAVDADEDSGRTEDGLRRYDDVRPEADARLRLAALQWEVEPRGGPRDAPPGPRDAPRGPPPANAATDPEDRIVAFRLVARALAYRPQSVLLLPAPWRAFDPWDVVVALCDFLDTRSDHGAVFVGHHGEDEDPRYAELRAHALLHLLDGNADAWVELAAKDGRVGDVQGFLQYLEGRHGWPTGVAFATDRDDEATHGAVERFQQTYNVRFERDIFEDGVIGVQTLGAIFEVARDDLERHLELGGARLESLRWFGDSRRALASTRATAHHFPSDQGRSVDVVLLPLDADIDLTAEPAAIDVYERPRVIEDVAIATVDVGDVGTLILDFDLAGSDPEKIGYVLHLHSTDGATDRRYGLTANDVDIAHARFDGLDPGASYSLSLSWRDAPADLVIFEEVPFADIPSLPPTPPPPIFPESGDAEDTIDDPDAEEAGSV